MQVRDVDAVRDELEEAGVDVIEPPTDKPWGLREMQIRDPDGLSIVIVEVDELIRAGKVREVGCSNFSADQLREAEEAT